MSNGYDIPTSLVHSATNVHQAAPERVTPKLPPIQDTWSVWFFIARFAFGLLLVVIILGLTTYLIAK